MAKTKNEIEVEKSENFVTANALAHMLMNATTIRREILQKLLNPGRNINFECGYPDRLDISDYKGMFDREGVAARVVGLFPEESWALLPTIYENEESEETEFERVWEDLNKKFHLLHYLHRIDVLSGIGQYGLLLMGINDGKELSESVDGIDLATGAVATQKKYELLYLKPFDESILTIKANENDVRSPRFGYPTMYNIDFEDVSAAGTLKKKEVHWTRILHVADNRTTSEILGTPRMKPVYNRLLDLRKIVGGSGEMFWRGAFPGFSFEVNPDLRDATIDQAAIKKEFEKYSAGLQRYLALTGVTAKSLSPQVADPMSHVKTQIMNIAIALGVPWRIFMGSEEAKLASTQDKDAWNKRVAKRQESYLTPMLVRPFVDRLIIYGVLPQPKEYFIDWPDLSAPTDKEKAEVAKSKTEAFAKYVGGNVDGLIAPKEFLMMIMNMTEDEADVIEKGVTSYMKKVEAEELAEQKELKKVGVQRVEVKPAKKKKKRFEEVPEETLVEE